MFRHFKNGIKNVTGYIAAAMMDKSKSFNP